MEVPVAHSDPMAMPTKNLSAANDHHDHATAVSPVSTE